MSSKYEYLKRIAFASDYRKSFRLKGVEKIVGLLLHSRPMRVFRVANKRRKKAERRIESFWRA